MSDPTTGPAPPPVPPDDTPDPMFAPTTPSPFDVPDVANPYAGNSVAGVAEVPDCDPITGLNPLTNDVPDYVKELSLVSTPGGLTARLYWSDTEPPEVMSPVAHASRRLDGQGGYWLVVHADEELYYGREKQDERTIGGDPR